MNEAILKIFDWIQEVIYLLERIRFNILGIDVSFLWLIIASIIICLAISVFWKGAKM